jgi:hypothetical protein
MTRPHRPRARYADEVRPEHVGRRVSIRRMVDEPDGTSRPSDVVGHLRRWDEDGTIEVETRDGTRVTLAARAILASRLVPEPPPRRRPRPGPPPTGSARG